MLVITGDLTRGHSTSCGKCGANIINEIGNKYGKLLVVDKAEPDDSGATRWVCKCDCGNTTISRGTSLRNGHSTSCGCERNYKLIKYNIEQRPVDITGRRFGKLVAIKPMGKKRHHMI